MFSLADLESLVREDVDDWRLGRKVEREPYRDGAMVRVCADRDGEDARQREQQLDPSVVVGKVALFGVDEARELVQDRKGLLRRFISARIMACQGCHGPLHPFKPSGAR